MAKVRSVVRCMTSRQVCFPAIFTIALISLAITTLQFSNVNVPTRTNKNWKKGKAQSPYYKERNQKLVRSWNPDIIRENFHKMNKLSTDLETESRNLDPFQKIEVPNFIVKKKQLRERKLPDKKLNKENVNKLTTRIGRAKMREGPYNYDAAIVRQWTAEYTSDSPKITGKYLDLENSMYVYEKEMPADTNITVGEPKLELPPQKTKVSTIKSRKVDSIQKIRESDFELKRQRIEQSRLPAKEMNKRVNVPATQTTRAKTATNEPHKNDVQIVRQQREKLANKSQTLVGNYSEFTESLKDILYDVENTDRNMKDVIREEPKLELLPEQTKGVIIVTNYRSGSTFLGELFNQHPGSFYTFEPLYPFGSNCSFEARRRVQVLHDMLKCNFPSMKKLYEDLNKNAEILGRVHQGCVRNNFCFRYNHKDLCTKDICQKGNTDKCTNCGPTNLDLVNNKCRGRKISVIKVIKLCFIQSLEPIFLDPSFDLKIIHLVRDPRGIASSRFKIHPDWDVAENIMTTCLRQAANVRAGRNIDWLKDRYKLVRYEDIAANPIESAKDIYNFVGLQFVDSVKSWILQNTRSQSKANANNIRAKRLGVKDEYNAAEDPYSTQRDSNTAMQAWRKHLSFQTVNKIQQHCFEALRSLGYKDFKTSNKLTNLNITSVL